MQSVHADRSILLFTNADFAVALSSGYRLLQAALIQKIVQFFVVDLEKAALDDEF